MILICNILIIYIIYYILYIIYYVVFDFFIDNYIAFLEPCTMTLRHKNYYKRLFL